MSVYTLEELQEQVKRHGSIELASRATGVAASTYRRRFKKEGVGLRTAEQVEVKNDLPPDDISADEIWSRALADSKIKMAYLDAEDDWRRRKINIDGPFGILWFGDPHLDDAHANIVKAQEHIDIANSSDAILPANLGDSLNNWVGSLQRLYASQNVGASRALKMYEKFLNDVPWWLWLFGNHCMWPTQNGGVMKKLAMEGSPRLVAEWSVKLAAELPNGRVLKIHAAHNFKGTSKFNKNHGLFVENLETGGEADILVAGDHHVWQTDQVEHEKTNRVSNLIRARGYKLGGEYEKLNGFRNQKRGHAVMTVINPDKEGPGFVTTFADAAYGAHVLKLLRADWLKHVKAKPRKASSKLKACV